MYGRILCLLCIVLTACSDFQRPEQLDRVTVLENQLKEAQHELAGISDSTLFSIYLFAENLKVKMEFYAPDTLNLENALRLDRYCMAGRNSLFILDERNKLQDLLPEYEEDLRRLKKDIELGSGQRHRYDEFLLFEEEKIKAFYSRVDACERMLKEVIDVDDELRAVLNTDMHEQISATLVLTPENLDE